MQSMLHRSLMLAAALAAAGCNELIGAGSPEVIEDPSAPGKQDQETGGEGAGVCGDGALAAGEECDDGNATDGDGCSACVMDCGQKPEFKDPDTHHCYRLEDMSAKTWEEAGSACAAWNGGTLATITTLDEFVVIQNRVRDNTWIGGIVEEGSDSFKWITGETWDFAMWAKDRPLSDGDKACVLIEKEYLMFMDAPCETPSMFVCERAPAGSM